MAEIEAVDVAAEQPEPLEVPESPVEEAVEPEAHETVPEAVEPEPPQTKALTHQSSSQGAATRASEAASESEAQGCSAC